MLNLNITDKNEVTLKFYNDWFKAIKIYCWKKINYSKVKVNKWKNNNKKFNLTNYGRLIPYWHPLSLIVMHCDFYASTNNRSVVKQHLIVL